jgi:carbonic anhydrase
MPTPEILAGIRRFRESLQKDPERLERLASQGQSPRVLFIACSDSRVAPEIITQAQLGDLYVVRSVGNLIPPFGTGEAAIGAALEHALLHLHVEHVVVCGHTDCGCIKALDAHLDWGREPHLARWVEHARPAGTKVEASGLPADEQHLATVRENVLLQLEHLRSYDPVREAERAGTLTLHGWVVHVETGEIEAYSRPTATWGAISEPSA